MPPAQPDTDQLLARAEAGDDDARNRLLDRHRQQLRNLIALRMDPRLAARVDPSDVVQESLAAAVQRLSDYVRAKPLPFYPWLRQIALERLIDLQRLHVRSQKRSVRREEFRLNRLPDDSVQGLARLANHGSAALNTAGTQSLTATDTATGSITGTEANITVAPAGLAALGVTGFPSPTTAGVAASITVTARNTDGSIDAGYLGEVSRKGAKNAKIHRDGHASGRERGVTPGRSG